MNTELIEFFKNIQQRMEKITNLRKVHLDGLSPETNDAYVKTLEELVAGVLATYVVTGKVRDFTKEEKPNPVAEDMEAAKKEGFVVGGNKKPTFRDVLQDAIDNGFNPEGQEDD